MQEKIYRFIQSHLGHVILAFALYCLFIVVVLFSLKFFAPKQGINGFADGFSVGLDEQDIEATTKSLLRPIKLAIIVVGMGLSDKDTLRAVEELPEEISFAFSPYTKKMEHWLSESRRLRHELLLEVPMEPHGYPDNDPGPISLLTRYSDAGNVEMLKDIMRRANGYDGVITWMGGKFMSSTSNIRPIFEYLTGTKLLFLNTVSQETPQTLANMAKKMNVPYLQTQFVLDDVATREAILLKLNMMEKSARIGSGHAIAIVQPYPITIEVLQEWGKTLKEKNITLVPITTIAE